MLFLFSAKNKSWTQKSTLADNTPLHKQQSITCLCPGELGQLAEAGLLGTGIL